MDMEDQVREALLAELTRQSENNGGRLKVQTDDQDGLTLEGRIDLSELTMAVVGAVAGGP